SGQTAIVGATNGEFTITNATFENQTLYSVRVSNPVGAVISSSALLTVRIPNPPYVSITQPYPGESTDVLLATTAISHEGTVRKVEFFGDGRKIGEATNAPWDMVWSKAP